MTFDDLVSECCTHCGNCGRSFCRDQETTPCEANGVCPDCCACADSYCPAYPYDEETAMTLTVHADVVQGSEAWLDQRRGMVTASVVGKLLTPTLKVADNDTSRGLTATLVAERISGFTEETPVNSDMWRGVESEPIARDIYSGHYHQAAEVGFMVREEDGWTLGYSPDGLIGSDGLIEIKAPRAKTHLNTILAGSVPPHYMAQCQAGLLVSGRAWLDFVSYCGGMPLFVKRVHPDPQWQEAIIAAVKQFETAATELTAAYRERIDGLPTTERIASSYEVELKL